MLRVHLEHLLASLCGAQVVWHTQRGVRSRDGHGVLPLRAACPRAVSM